MPIAFQCLHLSYLKATGLVHPLVPIRGCPLLRFKDAPKRKIVAIDIMPGNQEELAWDRPEWQRRLRKEVACLDEECLARSVRKD